MTFKLRPDPHPTESQEQTGLLRWAALRAVSAPELALLHHIPNGGLRHMHTAIQLKRQGVKPGVPDLHLPVPRGTFHGLYIEMKRRSGGVLSENQRWWIDRLTEQGYKVVVAYGASEAIREIESYLSLTGGNRSP